jgi:hypothetical protein
MLNVVAPCRSVRLHIEHIIYLCCQTRFLNEEVNCTELSPQVRFPASGAVTYPFDVNKLVCLPLKDIFP